MKKRILFIIDSLNCGGAEKSLISLLPLLDYSRLDVDLLIFKRGGVFEKYLPHQVNVINHDLYGSGVIDMIGRGVHQLKFSYNLRYGKKRHGAENHWRSMHKAVKPLNDKYDVAIAYQQGMPTFFLASKVDAEQKIAWVNVNIYAAGYDMSSYCKQFYDVIDRVVTVSHDLEMLVKQESPWMKEKIECIYDIVNQELIRRLSIEPVNDMLLSGVNVALVTVGRLADQKNYSLAVNAARLLKDRGLNFKWFFVGDGAMRRSIEQEIIKLGLQKQVELLGFKENPYTYMAKADVYVQTSKFEGFGLTIAEAKILHLPVVSTNFDVVYDQITDYQNGLIADMTPESVADKILEVLNNEELRNIIISNLKKENNLTATTEILKFNSIIES